MLTAGSLTAISGMVVAGGVRPRRHSWPVGFRHRSSDPEPRRLCCCTGSSDAGDRDPVPVKGRTAQLARRYPTVMSVSHPTANHDLPLAEPDWCRLLLGAGLTPSDGHPPVPPVEDGLAALA